MKQIKGWWFPDHERHLPVWMAHPKNKLLLNGRQAYQGKKQIAALGHCKQFRTAVDVGGHVGLWSFNLAHLFGEVHAFEPVAEHRECFSRNTPGLTTLRLHALALGAEAGSVRIDTETGSSGNSTVGGPGEIPMVTLDSMHFTEVDFIKIDCEGYEENVLRGAAETIKEWKPTIIVEQKRDMSARFGLASLGAVQYLTSLGYHTVAEISGDFIMVA